MGGGASGGSREGRPLERAENAEVRGGRAGSDERARARARTSASSTDIATGPPPPRRAAGARRARRDREATTRAFFRGPARRGPRRASRRRAPARAPRPRPSAPERPAAPADAPPRGGAEPEVGSAPEHCRAARREATPPRTLNGRLFQSSSGAGSRPRKSRAKRARTFHRDPGGRSGTTTRTAGRSTRTDDAFLNFLTHY